MLLYLFSIEQNDKRLEHSRNKNRTEHCKVVEMLWTEAQSEMDRKNANRETHTNRHQSRCQRCYRSEKHARIEKPVGVLFVGGGANKRQRRREEEG